MSSKAITLGYAQDNGSVVCSVCYLRFIPKTDHETVCPSCLKHHKREIRGSDLIDSHDNLKIVVYATIPSLIMFAIIFLMTNLW